MQKLLEKFCKEHPAEQLLWTGTIDKKTGQTEMRIIVCPTCIKKYGREEK